MKSLRAQSTRKVKIATESGRELIRHQNEIENDVKITAETGQELIRDDQKESFDESLWASKKRVQMTAEEGRELIRDHRSG